MSVRRLLAAALIISVRPGLARCRLRQAKAHATVASANSSSIDDLQDGHRQRPQHLLSGSRPGQRAGHPAAARLSVIVADVRHADAAARRPLSSGRARLSRLWKFGRAPPDKFAYTFDAIADIVGAFTEAVHLDRYALYVQDYGGPVGYRLAVAHPERVTALIVQNAVAHEEGLGRLQAARTGFWADRAANEAKYRAGLASVETARQRHVERLAASRALRSRSLEGRSRVPGPAGRGRYPVGFVLRLSATISPLTRRGRTGCASASRRRLIVWGRYDPMFDIAEVAALKQDVPKAEVHVLDAGHFALDEAGERGRQADARLSWARLPSCRDRRRRLADADTRAATFRTRPGARAGLFAR